MSHNNKFRAAPLFVLLSLLLLANLPAAAAESDPYNDFFNQSFGDFAEELQTARDEGKQGVMLFFEMDECPFCHYMKTNVLSKKEVQDYFRQHFLLFPVDIEGDIEVVDFDGTATTQKELSAVKYRVRATPVIAFFDLDGKLVHRHTGRTSGVEEFMLMGRYVAEGHYKSEKFTRFKREQRK